MSARASFGTPEKRTNDGAETALAKMEQMLVVILCALGLHDISCLNPTSGLVAALVNEFNVSSVDDFLWVDDVFHEEASAADSGGHPTSATVQNFCSGISSLTWVNSGNAGDLSRDKRAVAARFMRAYKKAMGTESSSTESSAFADEGKDLDTDVDDNMSGVFKNIYGYPAACERLASLSLCNSLHRQMSKGIQRDELRAFNPRGSVRPRAGLGQMVTDLRSGKSKVENAVSSKAINTHDDFISCVECYMETACYVSVIHLAPTPDWGGDPQLGVMRGIRYQITKNVADRYVIFWKDWAPKFRNHVDVLVSLEADCRADWIRGFSTERKSLSACAMDSIKEHRPVVLAAFKVLGFKKPGKGGGKGDGGFGGGKGDAGGKGGLKRGLEKEYEHPGKGGGPPGGGPFDFTKQRGFRDGCKPFPKDTLYEGYKFCQEFNRVRNCPHGDGCQKWHKCDCLLPNGKPCFDGHSRQDHVL